MKEKLTRRELFKKGGILGSAIFLVFEIPLEDLWDLILLNEYQKSIEEEKLRLGKIVSSYPLFVDFKDLTMEEQLEDFEMYYAIWKAAETKFGVSRLLLWIIHFDESDCSRAEFPERNGYLGGMQRNPEFYSEEYVREAVFGWEFLKWLPQRYLKKTGSQTNDYEEIFFTARKIGEKAKEIMAEEELNLEESCLKALDDYCSLENAERRRKQYRLIRTLRPQWD